MASTSRIRQPVPSSGRRSSRNSAAARCRLRSRRVPTTQPTTASRRGSRRRSISAAVARPNPARPLLHRMNRAEYRNADPRSARARRRRQRAAGRRRDLRVRQHRRRPGHVAAAARELRDDGAQDQPDGPRQHRDPGRSRRPITTPEDLTQDYHLRDLPLGTRGGLRVEEYFPVDAEYEIRVRLRRTATGSIRGISDEHQLELTLDGERIGLFPVGGKDAYRAVGRQRSEPRPDGQQGVHRR